MPFARAGAHRPHDHEDRTDRDRAVGDVERGPLADVHEVDDRATEEARRPEDPVDQVPDRAGEHERERDHEQRVVRTANGADEEEGHDPGDDREHGRERLEHAERATGVPRQPEADGVADDRDRAVGELAHRPRLREHVERDDREDDPSCETGSPLAAIGVVRHAPCSRRRSPRREGPRGARPRCAARQACRGRRCGS